MAVNISMKAMAARTKKRFPIPMLLSILTFIAALAAIWIMHEQPVDPGSFPRRENDPAAVTAFLAAFSGLCFSVAGALLAEAAKKARLRIGLPLAGFAFGAGLFCLSSGCSPAADICACLAASAVLLCCALAARGERPRESLCQALGCVFISGAVSALVMLVLSMLISAVTALFFPGIGWEISTQLTFTAFAVSSLLAAPFLLFSFLPGEETPREKYAGFRKVLAFVVLPACLLLLAVLLGYIVTIILMWKLPVGQMNPFAMTALGMFAGLHLLLTGEENRLSRFFVRHGAWMLLPVIVVQAIAVYIRIDAYGLTQARILGLAFTAACMIPVAAAFLNRYGRAFFIVAAVLLFILAATPLNTGTLARWNQEARLYGALAHAGMLDEGGTIRPNADAPEEDRVVIWSSASYLNQNRSAAPDDSRSAGLVGQLDATVEEEEKLYFYGYSERAERLFGFRDPVSAWYYESRVAEGPSSSTKLDVAGFSRAEYFRLSFNEKDDWQAELCGETITLDMLLPHADFDTGIFNDPDIVLPGGCTLRVDQFTCSDHFSREDGVHTLTYRLEAWLMTP